MPKVLFVEIVFLLLLMGRVLESLFFELLDSSTKLQSPFQNMPDGFRIFVTTMPKDDKKLILLKKYQVA